LTLTHWENEVVASGPASHVLGFAGIIAKLVVRIIAIVGVCLALEDMFEDGGVGED
tara:strand:+ start:983 stop:1150 length:168 start_codon:yes stop_codon:yes gene_type:complete